MSDSMDMMSRLNFDMNRVSKHSKVNTFGKRLIDFCKNNDTLILNGRDFVDKGVGKPTFKDKSVDDNVICSSTAMMFLSNFEIKEFCPLYSDAHNVIKFALKDNVMPTQPKTSSCPEAKHKRLEENKKKLLLFENLIQNKVNEIQYTLNDMTQPNKDYQCNYVWNRRYIQNIT